MRQLGRGQPIQPHITRPRDWSASVPASPLKPGMTRFGSTAASPRDFFTTGEQLITIPVAVVIAVSLLQAVRYGSVAPDNTAFFGLPAKPLVTIPTAVVTAVAVLQAVRYGTQLLDAPALIGVPVTPHISIPPLPVIVILGAVRYGWADETDYAKILGQPIQPRISIPKSRVFAIRVRNTGWVSPSAVYVRSSGAWVPVNAVRVRSGGVWITVWP